MSIKYLLALLLAIAIAYSHAATITGRVVAVADGDTVTVLDGNNTQHKIRLAGIDAPEKKQPYGQRSKQSLSDLVFDKQVNVETDKTDKYGREVGKILVNGQDANLEQVTRGFAWHYKEYQREQDENDRKLYDFAEKEARAARRGLWADADPMPPWDFRHKGK
jgi:endonuclease YncB( thermonuclease family)